MKNYILDTNILLTDSNSIFNFEDNHVIIPMIVIEELDRHKDRQDEAGKNARDLSRFLSNLLIDSSEVKKVKLFTGGLLSIVSTEEYNSINLNISSDLDMKYGDNKIILFSLKCQKFNFSNYQEETVLVSRDLLLRVKGTAFGLKVEDYKKENVIKTKDELYTGSKIIESVDLDISKMYQDAKDNNGTFAFLLNEELYPNEFIIFKNGNTSIITRYLGNNLYKKVSDSASSFKLKAKNKEQLMALDLLLDPDIKLVTLAGKSGTGKTVCALAAGLEQTSLNPTSKSGGNKQYQSLVCMKPTVSVGREIGFMPGGLQEKMEPWLAPIKDNLRYLIGQGKKDKMLDQTLNMYFENGIIEVEAISFIRGRSIANAFIIIDETQNITHHELKTILTRVGDNTKIILLGDPEQSDVTHLNALNNGLSIAIEKFKEYSIAGHVTLEKGERSELATISSKILG